VKGFHYKGQSTQSFHNHPAHNASDPSNKSFKKTFEIYLIAEEKPTKKKILLNFFNCKRKTC
jgi:hypothetical protein